MNQLTTVHEPAIQYRVVLCVASVMGYLVRMENKTPSKQEIPPHLPHPAPPHNESQGSSTVVCTNLVVQTWNLADLGLLKALL